MPFIFRENMKIHAKDKTDVWLNKRIWKHICEGHYEMRKCLPEIIETLKNPEAIYQSWNGTRFAYSFSERKGKFIMVLYHRNNRQGRIKTAYATSDPDSGLKGMMKVY